MAQYLHNIFCLLKFHHYTSMRVMFNNNIEKKFNKSFKVFMNLDDNIVSQMNLCVFAGRFYAVDNHIESALGGLLNIHKFSWR